MDTKGLRIPTHLHSPMNTSMENNNNNTNNTNTNNNWINYEQMSDTFKNDYTNNNFENINPQTQSCV
jgi:dihydroneopterin aldolase